MREGDGMDASNWTAAHAHRRDSRPAKPTHSGLKVALVHDWLTGMRGGEKCLDVLCQAFPDATLHTLFHKRGALSPAIERMAIRTSPMQRLPGVLRHYRKLLPIMPAATKAWRVGDVDLVVSLSHCVAKAVRVPEGVPHVCYCFTPMRYAWEGREAYLESWRDKTIKRALAKGLLNHLRDWDRRVSENVTHFVSISETIRDRITRCYGRESRVIQPPVDVDFYRPGDDARSSDYLVVSALVPYKRIDHAIEACTRAGKELTVIGEGPERARLEAMAGPLVRFLGWQADDVIRRHYQTSRALLFPGEEDFGIVPVEALACGCPVIAFGRGGVAENVDNLVGRTYDEATTDSLRNAIEGWEADNCPFDQAEARRRAEALALPVFQSQLLDFLDDALGRSQTIPSPHLNADRSRRPAG
jgi:glycosyltransferase involved in cell wall biosynthesis